MNILISSSSIDSTTDLVIDWIYSINKNVNVIRINDDINYSISFRKEGIVLLHSEREILLDDVDSYWYRRGRLRYKFNIASSLNQIRVEEERVLEEYLNFILKKKRSINDYFNSDVNKLIVLEEARKLNISTPKTYILESRDELLKIMSKPIITKNYLSSSGFTFDDGTGIIFTNNINDLNGIDVLFSPSLFQTKIEKKIELRIFYLNGRFWTMAIFSQSDEQTKTDFRVYNFTNPNKNVPFNLPKQIEKKLEKLMKQLNLDTGSIDMILTEENEYVFLEVNPIGQFGMVSFPCNFNIEKEIAKYLCYED